MEATLLMPGKAQKKKSLKSIKTALFICSNNCSDMTCCDVFAMYGINPLFAYKASGDFLLSKFIPLIVAEAGKLFGRLSYLQTLNLNLNLKNRL